MLFVGSPAWAIDLPQVVFSGPGYASFSWDTRQEMQLFGVPVVWRSFTVLESLENTAELLSKSTDRFQRVIAAKDRVMLSGVNGDWSWVAELESAPHGVKGRVSALHINAERLRQALDQRSSFIFSWLPQQAQLRFTQGSIVGNSNALQQFYSVNMSSGDLSTYVKTHLRRAGWRDESSSARLAGASVWSYKAARLVLVAQEGIGDSSSLFVHYFE
jgi:hypothetical protein